MKLFEKIKKTGGKREIRLFGIKIIEYQKNKNDILTDGIFEYETLPISKLHQSIEKTNEKITLIYPAYYQNDNHESFYQILKEYDKLSDEIKERLKIIIVDDCSKHPLTLPNLNINITLLRINVDIPWNNSGARNLGACFADTRKIILADIDWFFPEETLNVLINSDVPNDTFVVFNSCILNNNVERTSVHPNTYCVLKHTFFKYGGYDEKFCGFYGEDIFFRKNIMRKNAKFMRLSSKIINNFKYEEHFLSRDLNKIRKILTKNPNIQHSGKILQFPWSFVDEKFYVKK